MNDIKGYLEEQIGELKAELVPLEERRQAIQTEIEQHEGVLYRYQANLGDQDAKDSQYPQHFDVKVANMALVHGLFDVPASHKHLADREGEVQIYCMEGDGQYAHLKGFSKLTLWKKSARNPRPRIRAGVALREWFNGRFNKGDIVRVTIEGIDTFRLEPAS